MMRLKPSIISLFCLLLLLIVGVGCDIRKNETDWSVNLSEKSKQPFGLYLAYESLPMLFPEGKFSRLDPSYEFSNLFNRFQGNQRPSVVIVVGQNMELRQDEVESIIELAEKGHTFLLAVAHLDHKLLQALQLRQSPISILENSGALCFSAQTPSLPEREFCYSGFDFPSYFKPLADGKKFYTTIGYNHRKEPNFIAFQIGEGRILLHASPFVFSNYFLLQNNNQEYFRYLFAHIPKVESVLWMSFNKRALVQEGAWAFLWKHPGTRMFVILSIIVLLLYVLFESKRKQKIIPVVVPNTNSSVAFVETVGRLYFNKGNHQNLAEKMSQHFMDFVRSHYHLSTAALNDEFIQMLSAKSGVSYAATATLIADIKAVHDRMATIDEAFLFSLHSQIQQFYNK
jgi:hypothetical protein